ncbi:hypothetical protein D6C83_01877, partial [Aureobasidium pullulans]
MATALQPTFGLQQPEDSMEISSEYGNMDADIDIDLDAPDAVDTNMQSFQQQSFQQDDHHMQEDPKSDRLDDDLMIDDSNLDDPDRIMQDDAPVPQEQDEELLDFSEDEEDVPMNPAENTEPESHLEPQYQAPIEQSAPVEEPVEHVQSEVASELLTKGVQPVDNTATQTEDTQQQSEAQQPIRDQDATNEKPENVAQAQSTHEVTSEPQPETQEEAQPSPAADSAEQTKPSAHETVIESTEFPNATNDNVDESAHAAHPTENEHKEQGNDNAETGVAQEADEESFQPSLTRQETDLSNYTVPEDYSRERQANSPTVTGLHPTIVEYQENEVYLFPSRDPAVPEQYLLQNENLVTTSLGDLLQACRTALGDGISEDEELVLGVEELDLYVSEDSTPAFSTSFSELLDMYLQLHRLDGNDNPPPFRVSLTTKTRFSNRMAAITQAISEGEAYPTTTTHDGPRVRTRDGEKIGKYREVKAARLHQERGVTFWRFNLEIELGSFQARVAYRINRGPAIGFWVPARGESMNIMFHSCNGFSLSVNSNEFTGPDPLWRDVLNKHLSRPFHVMLGGGDQIYNDAAMRDTTHFKEWLQTKNPEHKHRAEFSEDMQDELETFYLDRYSMWFSQGLFGMANSQIPMVNIWDDHDIIDGYGSYPHHFMSTRVFTGLGAVAFKYYMLFQHQSVVSETQRDEPSWVLGASPGPYINELSRSVFMFLGRKVTFPMELDAVEFCT